MFVNMVIHACILLLNQHVDIMGLPLTVIFHKSGTRFHFQYTYFRKCFLPFGEGGSLRLTNELPMTINDSDGFLTCKGL